MQKYLRYWVNSRRGVKDLLVNRTGKLYGQLEIPLTEDDVSWQNPQSPDPGMATIRLRARM